MERTPQEVAYWKKVFPDTDGKPPFTPYAGCLPGGYRRCSELSTPIPVSFTSSLGHDEPHRSLARRQNLPEMESEISHNQTQTTSTNTNEMDFTGYIKNVKETISTMADGSKRTNLRITMSENKGELKDSYPGIVFYVKSDLVANVKDMLSKDPDHNCRYKVKADGWVKEKPSKTNPAEKYDDMYLRAWMFELTF